MTLKLKHRPWLCTLVLLFLPGLALAAEFDGSQLSPWWGVPFAGILLSIALMPLLVPVFWHHHFGKVTAAWSLAFCCLLPWFLARGWRVSISCTLCWLSTFPLFCC